MKKLAILFVVVAAIGATSCKKENETKPALKNSKTVAFDKKDLGSWD